ncbi:MAG: hypothetical protein HZA31_11290 [Opitutae bacterium]|nr:hypothetical protein [Opitutae bacterium]
MTDAKPSVWLLVTALPAPLAALTRAQLAVGGRHVVLLTSHSPYPEERTALIRTLAPAKSDFIRLADLFDDQALATLDEAASRELLPHRSPWESYANRYERLVTANKNAAALARLRERFRIERIFCTAAPGIDVSFWRKQGAQLIGALPKESRWPGAPLRRIVQALRYRLGRPPETGILITDGTDRYLFLAALRRLRLKPGVAQQAVKVRDAIADADFVATTMHDHPDAVHCLGRPVRVFADLFLPSNYPRSYLDTYGQVEFVGADPLSYRWFHACGMPTAPIPSFIAQPRYAPAVARPAIRTLVLLCNHGGDWTALIHRSDTDLLVEASAALARVFPELKIVLRLHPTMVHPRHEGVGAQERINRFIASAGLPNLAISNATLAEDLERGDFFLSEYSATLLDAWREGRLGLAVNLTRRRSFMQDFVELGFPEATSVETLIAMIEAACTDTAAFVARQTAAAMRYNALLPADHA